MHLFAQNTPPHASCTLRGLRNILVLPLLLAILLANEVDVDGELLRRLQINARLQRLLPILDSQLLLVDPFGFVYEDKI